MEKIHWITLDTKDNHTVTFLCSEDTDIVSAAKAAGIRLPIGCSQGGCGFCLVNCPEGDYHLGQYNQKSLTPEMAAQRDILPCCAFPRSPLRLKAPYDAIQIQQEITTLRIAKITEIKAVADKTLYLRLQLEEDDDGNRALEFEPGQYVELGRPGSDVRRAYSLANIPNWDGVLEFYIRLHDDGKFSNYLSHAQIEDILEVKGPFGAFTLQENGLRPRWFLAGGTGLAPVLSMLRKMAEWQEPHEAKLYFGVNRETELFALAEIEELSTKMPKLQKNLCLWQPDGEDDYFHGTPTDAMKRDLEIMTNGLPDIYLCGPPKLMDLTKEIALKYGIPESQIFSEKF